MGAPGQEKLIIFYDTFGPKPCWLEEGGKELSIFVATSQRNEMFWPWSREGAQEMVPTWKSPSSSLLQSRLALAGRIYFTCSFGVSNSVFVCFLPAFVLIDDSWFACGCFFSSASLHVWRGRINGHKRRRSQRPSLDFFSVTAVVPILLMASYVSGHKEIPH